MDKSWIKIRNRTNPVYMHGVENFLEFVYKGKLPEVKVKCPCITCQNLINQKRRTIYEHLIMRGFLESYTDWSDHRVEAGVGLDKDCDGVRMDVEEDDYCSDEDDLDALIEEAGFWEENVDAENFQHLKKGELDGEMEKILKLLSESKKELYPGSKFMMLSFILRLLRIKTTYRWSNKSFSVLLEILKVALPECNLLPSSYREALKVVKVLGLDYKKIHACPNNCMLYWKEAENYTSCSKCSLSRYKTLDGENGSRKVPAKVARYFPLKPRLQRLFMCSETAPLMRWHENERIKDGVQRHPADSLAWRSFDEKNPLFASEVRNVRLGLATDGFNPFKSRSVSHSIWPIVLIPYNVPPGMCMTQDNIIMSVLIDGPKGPGNDIDIYMQPLIEELVDLWDQGMRTYDVSTKEVFTLRVGLLWTISDLPGYDMVSGWNVKTEFGCSVCGLDTDSKWLKHGRKYCFRGHRRFLPEDHKFRTDFRSFDGAVELRKKPKRVRGDDLLHVLEDVITEYGKGAAMPPKKRRKLNISNGNYKKVPILHKLPYWKDNLIPHNFDIMHVENNFCHNIVYTILDVKDRTKDNLNSRLDLQLMGIRKSLHPQPRAKKKAYLPPACFSMSKHDKQIFLTVLRNVKMPDGFASNISRCVTKDGLNFSGLKSHDSHVLMELLMPIAVRKCLPKNVAKVLIELGNNFKQLYSKTNRASDFEALEDRIALTLCHLERIFPPSFFDLMEHLPIHLAEEAKVAGPVQFRSMWAIERYWYTLKEYVRSRSHPCASVAEGCLDTELMRFYSRFLAKSESIGTIKRNYEGFDNICKGVGQVIGATNIICLENTSLTQAHRYVLENLDILKIFREEHLEVLRRENYKANKYERRKSHNATFSQWFKKRVKELEKNDRYGQLTENIKSLAIGPDRWVKQYSGYMINGLRFHTKDREKGRKTQNSGVLLRAVAESYSSRKDKKPVSGLVDFYGVLTDIVELHYPNGLKYVLFKCDWVNSNDGVKKDEFEYTLVNFKHLLYKKNRITDEPYILASQAQQVWYVQDPIEEDWHVVVKHTPRDLIDMRSGDFVEGGIEHRQFHEQSLGDIDLNSGEEDGTWVREGIEGWVVDASDTQEALLEEIEQEIGVDHEPENIYDSGSEYEQDYHYSDDEN